MSHGEGRDRPAPEIGLGLQVEPGSFGRHYLRYDDWFESRPVYLITLFKATEKILLLVKVLFSPFVPPATLLRV